MGERDAFGNEKTDDPLAGMGWGTGGLGGQDAALPASPSPSLPQDPKSPHAHVADTANLTESGLPGPPPVVPRGSSSAPTSPFDLPQMSGSSYRATDVLAVGKVVGFVFKIALPLVIFGVVGLSIFNFGSDVADDVRKFGTSFTLPTAPTVSGETPGAPSPLPSSTPSAPPVGLGKGSLLKPTNFTTAIRRLQKEGSRARSVRVAADRIDASIVTATGRAKQVQVTSTGDVQVFGPATSGASLAGTFVLADLVRNAPSRLARQAASRVGRQPSSVDYMVALDLGSDGQAWTVFIKNGGGQFIADRSGRITRKNG